ncbi:hypothetical protein Xmau_01584 [Xenorhabdus mauleonii]|uniref:Uncharacterized protein n=1 Tax=Xenorhabdus mauleonii TaxID=351675 RepID=A0A1I3P9T8_9GAMM|nr:hypothetical protein [Xenorhabdus mauleonii]PHM44870.1 hypothetical protein Xmau_01584 [Xenorhabdus mauleonii]SFJ18318.1 hypothetical protein SAMN05421680_10677 [Xenorhabdus mauleonii]
MNITEALSNRQFKRILSLYKNIDDRIKSDDSSLIEEPDIARLKDKTAINRSSEEGVLLVLFPVLLFVSYIILVIVFYDFYFSSDAAGFRRSASMFIISVISLLSFYTYRGNTSSLKILNVLNTLSFFIALFIIFLDFFVYNMHHEWYLLIIVFSNFFSNRIIINSTSFSQAMTEILWFKTTNHLLRKQINSESDEHTDFQKKNIFMMLWQYCVLNTNLNNTLKESDKLNLRIERNDSTLMTEKRINKYQNLLDFGMSKKALLMTVFATILLMKVYVIGTFMLLSHFDNKNDLPILFFTAALSMVFASLSMLLTHRGVTLGFRMLILARFLFILMVILLVGFKFVMGILEYSNIALSMIVLEFLLVFFMLNTEYYSKHLRELHCFLAWHKIARNKHK